MWFTRLSRRAGLDRAKGANLRIDCDVYSIPNHVSTAVWVLTGGGSPLCAAKTE